MTRGAAVVLALCLSMGAAECERACSFGTNFSADIKGDPDTRQDTWGDAGYTVKAITFRPPPGYRVRILRVYGDFVVWPLGRVGPGRFAGVLLGLQTSGPEGSVRADWAGDNTMLYIQDATGGEARRAGFDFDTKAGGLLEADHKLLVKMAVWLNDTGLPIHMEPSMVVVYRYEREGDDGQREKHGPVVSDHFPGARRGR